MKLKYADYPNWNRVNKKTYINKHFDNEDFTGNISLLIAEEVKQKLVVNKANRELVILDNNFKWLEIYPENNPNIAVSAAIDDKDKIIEWYIDIAKSTHLTENGVPYIEDLYLDIVVYPSGKIEMLDEDELKEALNNKYISKSDFNLAYNVANRVIKEIEGKTEEITNFTNKYYELFK